MPENELWCPTYSPVPLISSLRGSQAAGVRAMHPHACREGTRGPHSPLTAQSRGATVSCGINFFKAMHPCMDLKH